MSLLAAYHTGRYLGPFAFSDDIEGNPESLTSWAAGPRSTVWEIGYFGPLEPDPLTRNGVILHGASQLSQLSRVTYSE